MCVFIFTANYKLLGFSHNIVRFYNSGFKIWTVELAKLEARNFCLFLSLRTRLEANKNKWKKILKKDFTHKSEKKKKN